MFGFVEIDVPADEQVESAVVVIIEPDRACRPAGRGDTRLSAHIGEGAVAIIVIQDATAVAGDEQVRKAIAVIVSYGDALRIASSADAGLFGDVRKSTVAVVLIKGVAQRRIGIVEVAFPAVDQEDVHPAVVVVIEKSAARAHGFW
jgi:hypothetical protein